MMGAISLMLRNEDLEIQLQTMDERILVLESTIHTILEELEVGGSGEFAKRMRKDLQSIKIPEFRPSHSTSGQSNMVFLLKSD